MKNPTCEDKQELAFRIDRPRIPLDGTLIDGYVTKTERNWYMPQMYYMAVMDCDQNIHQTVGHNKHGRIAVEVTMTADEDQFSYEKQGSLTLDSVLLTVFLTLFGLNFRDIMHFK